MLAAECCVWSDTSADPSTYVALVVGQGRCAEICSILTTYPAWVQSLADHPRRLRDTVTRVHGAFMKFRIQSFVTGNPPAHRPSFLEVRPLGSSLEVTVC